MQKTNVPTYIPLDAAVQKYGISEESLLKRIQSGKLASAKLPNGEYLVAEHSIDPSLKIRREDFEHLRGKGISGSESSRKYGISTANFSKWSRVGYIKRMGRAGRAVLLDEADVAYCAAVYHAKSKTYNGRLSGVNIFDKNGNPFQSKYPEMAAYKRRIRQRVRQETIEG